MSELSDWKRIVLPSELAAARAEGKAEGIAEVTEALSAAQKKIAELEAELAAFRRNYGCLACGENHPSESMCPPHEVRTTGQTWFFERTKAAVARAEIAEQALTAERQRRESAEAVAKPLALAYDRNADLDAGSRLRWLRDSLGDWHFKDASDHFTRYPTASDSEERGG